MRVSATSNFRKHGVSFETATHAFEEPFALVERDRIEDGEHRWQTAGLVGDYLVLLVARMTWDDEDGTEIFRIISAISKKGNIQREKAL